MTEIKLGQSIAASLTSNDTKVADIPNSINGYYYDEYTVSGLDAFRQVNVAIDFPLYKTATAEVLLVNADTNTVFSSTFFSGLKKSFDYTTFPGVNYKIQVIGSNFGDYTLTLNDGGKATSIVSPDSVVFFKGVNSQSQVGTVGASGVYFPLASGFSGINLFDVALSTDGQFYGLASERNGTYTLQQIDPSADGNYTGKRTTNTTVGGSKQIKSLGLLKDVQGNPIAGNGALNSLEFGGNNKLYAIGGDNFYEINVKTSVATLLGNTSNSVGFVSSGDLVYDAANQRFLVTALDTSTSDALWQIPATTGGGLSTENIAKATKIGQIGFVGVQGINLDNGKIVGFSSGFSEITKSTLNNRIEIDGSTGTGKLDTAISAVNGLIFSRVTGSSTIFGGNTPPAVVVPPAISTPSTVIDIIKADTTSIAAGRQNVIGSNSQGLPGKNTIDLTGYAGKALKTDITTKGDAAYTNNIGFYVVEDALLGTIKLTDGSLLNPGDIGYAFEAVKNAVLQAGKIDSKIDRDDLVGGKFYAPVVIAQGSFNEFVTKNPTNGGGTNDIHAYFNYVAGNSDKVDHFRFLGNNTFGVEDMYGGGDLDFNDLVVTVNIRTV